MQLTATTVNAPDALVNVLQAQMQAEAKRLLEQKATFIQLPSASFGVKGNGLGYPEKGCVLVHVASIVDPDTGKPVLDLKSVKVVTQQVTLPWGGQTTATLLEGAIAGPGAADVKLRVSLWLGNQCVGYRKAGEADNVTDSDGNAQFVLHAGTHAGNVQVRVEVVDNPVNPWCKPRATEDELLLFRPALQGDDKVGQVAYEIHPVKVGKLERGSFARSLGTMHAFDAQGTGQGDATTTQTLDGGRDLLRFQEMVSRHLTVEELSAHPEMLSRPIHRLTPGIIRPQGGRVHQYCLDLVSVL